MSIRAARSGAAGDVCRVSVAVLTRVPGLSPWTGSTSSSRGCRRMGRSRDLRLCCTRLSTPAMAASTAWSGFRCATSLRCVRSFPPGRPDRSQRADDAGHRSLHRYPAVRLTLRSARSERTFERVRDASTADRDGGSCAAAVTSDRRATQPSFRSLSVPAEYWRLTLGLPRHL